MKTLEEIFTFINLLKAHQRCRVCKGHKREVVEFELNLSENIIKIKNSILSNQYNVAYYRKFKIYEPKERIIESLNYKHRIVQNCLCYELIRPTLDNKLFYYNCACRLGKGTDFARKNLKMFLHNYSLNYGSKGYFLKCDIRKFFNSIDHEVLNKILSKYFEEDMIVFFNKFIKHNNETVGLPIGNQTSQWFALLYLNGLDQFIKRQLKIKYYIRYMDDFILLSKSKQELVEALAKIKEFLVGLKLELNNKTKISMINEGINFLGFKFVLHENLRIDMKLLRQSKTRLKNGLKKSYVKYLADFSDFKSFVSELMCYHQHATRDKTLNFDKYFFNIFSE